jgi:Ca2+-dependent lipid-binding protein
MHARAESAEGSGVVPYHNHEYVRAQIEITGHNLAARDVSFLHSSSSDPYLVFMQHGMLVAQTEVIEQNLNPVWQPLSINLARGSMICIRCMDSDKGEAKNNGVHAEESE